MLISQNGPLIDILISLPISLSLWFRKHLSLSPFVVINLNRLTINLPLRKELPWSKIKIIYFNDYLWEIFTSDTHFPFTVASTDYFARRNLDEIVNKRGLSPGKQVQTGGSFPCRMIACTEVKTNSSNTICTYWENDNQAFHGRKRTRSYKIPIN